MAPELDDTYAVAAKDLLRSRILDAVHLLLDDRPWAKVTMTAVADAAGVSRQTIYNEYGNRGDLAGAYVLREAGRFLADIDDVVALHHDDLPSAFHAALTRFHNDLADHPVLRSVAAGESDELVSQLWGPSGEPLLDLTTKAVADTFLRHWPALDLRELLAVAEITVRLAFSQITMPSADARVDADVVGRVLEPYLQSLATGA